MYSFAVFPDVPRSFECVANNDLPQNGSTITLQPASVSCSSDAIGGISNVHRLGIAHIRSIRGWLTRAAPFRLQFRIKERLPDDRIVRRSTAFLAHQQRGGRSKPSVWSGRGPEWFQTTHAYPPTPGGVAPGHRPSKRPIPLAGSSNNSPWSALANVPPMASLTSFRALFESLIVCVAS